MIFLNNIIIFGDSCSGKTFLYKNIIFKKIDLDFFLYYKNIIFINELYYRLNEKKIIKKMLVKIFLINYGGGSIYTNYKINFFYCFKNIFLYFQIKRYFIDNLNRPMLSKIKILKIRYCIRKKFYLKLLNFYINNCNFCNIKNIYEINKVKKK